MPLILRVSFVVIVSTFVIITDSINSERITQIWTGVQFRLCIRHSNYVFFSIEFLCFISNAVYFFSSIKITSLFVFALYTCICSTITMPIWLHGLIVCLNIHCYNYKRMLATILVLILQNCRLSLDHGHFFSRSPLNKQSP